MRLEQATPLAGRPRRPRLRAPFGDAKNLDAAKLVPDVLE
jgi:hypothetical protein